MLVCPFLLGSQLLLSERKSFLLFLSTDGLCHRCCECDEITWVLGIQKWRGENTTRKGDCPEFLWAFTVPFLSSAQSSRAVSSCLCRARCLCQGPCRGGHARVLEGRRGELSTGVIVFKFWASPVCCCHALFRVLKKLRDDLRTGVCSHSTDVYCHGRGQ